MPIRNATPADFPQILRLNEESVHFLSPMTPERLDFLYREAAYRRVVEEGGKVVAFLLAFREGSTYDSVNYQWFARNYANFLYIDRIVVAGTHQGRGIGPRFYADLFAFAEQTGASCVTCEFDVDPPNETSRRFHERFGFIEVGSQSVGASQKRVSLQARPLSSPATQS